VAAAGDGADDVAGYPLDAMNAERSWGAPLVGRSAGVVRATTGLTVAPGDDELAAVGKPDPPA